MLEKMNVKDLNDNPLNPRKIKDGHLALLTKSLEEFGDISGIVFNNSTQQLLGGHQRKVAFKENFPVIITQTYAKPTRTGTVREGYVDVDGERFAYREVAWSKEKELAANIAANKGAGLFDFAILQEHLNFLDAANFDLDLTMFDSEERDSLLGGWDSDISAIDKIEENLDGLTGKITITCPTDLKDEVLIYLKGKLMETSFEGVHIE